MAAIIAIAPHAHGDATDTHLQWTAYLDAGYLASSTRPGNHAWRSKGTTRTLDRLKVNNLTLSVSREASVETPLGFRFGLQAGKDVDNQVTANAVRDAETFKHFYYTSVSYLFDVGAGLTMFGGLIPGHIGYESFHAIDNPTYTRIYGVDNVPYFNLAAGVRYGEGTATEASFMLLNGWNYLEHPNDVPSLGLQLVGRPGDEGSATLNLYYGPDQAETAAAYWRFAGNVVAEWQRGSILVALSAGYGSEKQADLAGNPRYAWSWGAAWGRWQPGDRWSIAVRPEFFRDENGLMTGARQTIRAVTVGADYTALPFSTSAVSARVEYRYDRSTGPDGGFFDGDANALAERQQLFIVALLWRLSDGGHD